MFLKVCLGQLFMKARERRTASSGWRVDTGQRAGKASLLVFEGEQRKGEYAGGPIRTGGAL